MIDPKFTEQIALWLQGDHNSPEAVAAGAMLLLQLNRDHSMYQRIMRNPKRELKFLEYKLRRFLQMRQDGQTIKDVMALDSDITPQIQVATDTEPIPVEDGSESLPVVQETESNGDTICVIRKGIRPDHDRLPDNIKALWPKNAERWKKIKEVFETCKRLTEPCDRYEYLILLKETWYKYKEDMARYDEYQLTADKATVPDDSPSGTPALTPEQEKELANADSYVSKNLTKLLDLVNASKESDFTEAQANELESWRTKIQQRVDLLLKYGRTLTDERREQLISADISVNVPDGMPSDEDTQDNEQGQESE